MNKKTFAIEVNQTIAVTLDVDAFSDQFLKEFADFHFQLNTVEDHAKHIGQLFARGIFHGVMPNEFIEGYGPANEMGISAAQVDQDQSVQS